MNGNAAAIVTTLRNAGAVVDSFIAYHLAIGFSHIYLFFDDPNDLDLPRLASHPQVSAIPHDATLRQAWTALPAYGEHGPHIDREVMSRQALNVVLAMDWARARGLDWLLHIDADELFLAQGESVPTHFAKLSENGFETVVYRNYEAMPEREEIGDYFREVNLFKIPPGLFREKRYTLEGLRAVTKSVPQLAPNFFHFYNCGKSAVRLSSSGLGPSGVHNFARDGAPCKTLERSPHVILHYACCGFETFWTKYRTLGRFADVWWNEHSITAAIGTFHLEARDVVMRGDRAEAADFYRRRVMMSDPTEIAALIDGGFLARVTAPAEMIGSAPPAANSTVHG